MPMNITPYKGRAIDPTRPVKVYKNLTNGKWSIKQGSRVVAHADEVYLSKPRFEVNENGRQRVIRERKKYVHAFVTGYVAYDTHHLVGGTQVTYNPYHNSTFVKRTTGQPVHELHDHLAKLGCDGLTIIHNPFA